MSRHLTCRVEVFKFGLLLLFYFVLNRQKYSLQFPEKLRKTGLHIFSLDDDFILPVVTE